MLTNIDQRLDTLKSSQPTSSSTTLHASSASESAMETESSAPKRRTTRRTATNPEPTQSSSSSSASTSTVPVQPTSSSSSSDATAVASEVGSSQLLDEVSRLLSDVKPQTIASSLALMNETAAASSSSSTSTSSITNTRGNARKTRGRSTERTPVKSKDMKVVEDDGKQEARPGRSVDCEQIDAFEFMSEEYSLPSTAAVSSYSSCTTSSSSSSASGTRSRSRGRSVSTPKASSDEAAEMVVERVKSPIVAEKSTAAAVTAPLSTRKRRAAVSVAEEPSTQTQPTATKPSTVSSASISSSTSAVSLVEEEAKQLRLQPKEKTTLSSSSSAMAALSSALPPPAKKGRTALAAAKARALADLDELGGGSGSQADKENASSGLTSRRAAIAAASKIAPESEENTESFDKLFKVQCY